MLTLQNFLSRPLIVVPPFLNICMYAIPSPLQILISYRESSAWGSEATGMGGGGLKEQ